MPSLSKRIFVVVGAVLPAFLLATLPARRRRQPGHDNIAQAFGPLATGVNYDGQFETVNNTDRLYFYVGGAKQVQVRLTKVGAGWSATIGAAVRDQDGDTMKYDFDRTIASNTTSQFAFTTSAPGRFYVSLGNDCAGDPYMAGSRWRPRRDHHGRAGRRPAS